MVVVTFEPWSICLLGSLYKLNSQAFFRSLQKSPLLIRTLVLRRESAIDVHALFLYPFNEGNSTQ